MAAPKNATIVKATGLNTQPNELGLPPGALAVAENVEITRDDIIEISRGFEDFSSNIPDFLPSQIFSVGGVAYMHLDSGLWYYDTSSSTWLRKRGAFGAALTSPIGCYYLNGHLYVSTLDDVVLDMDLATGSRTILAGRFGVPAHTDGTGGAARFDNPRGITSDGTNLYVCDSNHCIRKIVIASGVVTTLCGTSGTTSGHVDSATAADVRFNFPSGIVYDGSANLYVCDNANHCIRKVVVATGETTTPYGTTGTTNAHTDGTGTAARFDGPYNCVIIGADLYVTDNNNNCIRKVVISSGVVTTPVGIADPATTAGHTDGTGNATRFAAPFGIATDGTDLYVSEGTNNCIRKIVVATGVVTTPIGSIGTTVGHVDGIGNAARFSNPHDIAFDGSNVLVSDYGNNAIRKVYVGTSYASTVDGVTTGYTASGVGLPLSGGIVVGPS